MSSISQRLFALKQRKTQLLNIPRLGECVIQVPAERERAEIESTLGTATVKRLVVVHCLVDNVDLINPATGTRREEKEVWLADPAIPAMSKREIDRLGQLDSTVIDDLASAALDLMKMSQKDRTELLGEPAQP